MPFNDDHTTQTPRSPTIWKFKKGKTMAKITKATLQARVNVLENKLDMVRKICLLRALRNDVRGGANIHTANAYRLVVKMFDDPAEIERVAQETTEWIQKGMPNNGK